MYLQNIPIIDISCLSDCHEYYEIGELVDGLYTIRLDDDVTVVNVKCLFLGGKRSTAILHRDQAFNLIDFDQNWEEYKHGFAGDSSSEFWLGNKR